MSRCDSAAMVPKTSELLPEPETPVKTVSRRFGQLDVDVLEVVLPRAVHADQVVARRRRAARPCSRSCSSAGQRALVGADRSPGGIADSAVADTVRLLGRLLHDLFATRREHLGAPLVTLGLRPCGPRPAWRGRRGGSGGDDARRRRGLARVRCWGAASGRSGALLMAVSVAQVARPWSRRTGEPGPAGG